MPKASPTRQPRSCNTCGTELPLEAIWCKNCELFQPEPLQTKQCSNCGLYVPAVARKCYKCSCSVDGRQWFNLSSDSIGPLTGLASALTLLIGTAGTLYQKLKLKKESQTTVAVTYVDDRGRDVVVGTRNTGDKYSAILEFQLLVTVFQGENKRIQFTEELVADAERRPGVALAHSEYVALHRLVPASSPHLWNLAESLRAAPGGEAVNARTRIAEQLLSEESELKPHCRVQYVIQESASDKFVTRLADQGNEKWTDIKCKKFLQVGYSGH